MTDVEYLSKLVTIAEAQERLGMSKATFWRFRTRHGVAVLTGRKVCIDDVINALDRERGLSPNRKSK
jgi:hypothetical protein